MIMFSPEQLRRRDRKLDRQQAHVDRVLATMRGGAALHAEHGPSGARWALSNGASVPAVIARQVVANPHVVGNGDGLFSDSPQTWQYHF